MNPAHQTSSRELPRVRRCTPLFLLVAALVSQTLQAAAPAAPSGKSNASPGRALMDRVVAAASDAATNNASILTNYFFVRWEMSEELDKKGVATKRLEKLYDHSPISGRDVLRETRENGKLVSKPPTAASAKQPPEKRKGKSGRRGDGRRMDLTAEMLDRFDFQLVGSTNLDGRSAQVIRFVPATVQPAAKGMNDRVLQSLRGRIIGDAAASQIILLEAELADEVDIWGGMAGSIKHFKVTLRREPVGGIWFDRSVEGEYKARAMFSTVAGRFASTNGGFQLRTAVPQMKSAGPRP